MNTQINKKNLTRKKNEDTEKPRWMSTKSISFVCYSLFLFLIITSM